MNDDNEIKKLEYMHNILENIVSQWVNENQPSISTSTILDLLKWSANRIYNLKGLSK
jgi:hypothetical protein